MKTHSRYSEVVRLHIIPHLKPKLKLMDVKQEHVEAILKAIREKGVGVRSQKYILSTLHKFFADMMVKRAIVYNPTVGIKITYKPPEMLTLSRDQVKLFLKTAIGNRNEHLFYLAFVTGMRQGELLGLKWSDIDEGSQSLMVQRQVQWVDHHTDKETPRFFFKAPKSKAGVRRIPVGPEAIKRLRLQRGQVVMQKMVNADKWQENDLVFPNLMGNPIDPNNLIKDLRKLLSEAALPAIRFHDIRHTCATLLLLKNVHPKVVCERLGHSDIRITLERYSHAIPSMQNEAAQMIEGLIGDDPVLPQSPSQVVYQPKTDVLDL
jgi:integrase